MLTAVRSIISHNTRQSLLYGCKCLQRRWQIASTMIISDIDPVAKNEIPNFLINNRIPFKAGYTCFSISCPRPRSNANKKPVVTSSNSNCSEEQQLYINTTTGYFMCKRCKKSGTWSKLKHNLEKLRQRNSSSNALKSCFNDDPVETEDLSDCEKISEFLSVCCDAPVESRDRDLLRSIGFQQLTWKTISEYGAKILPKKNGLILPVCTEHMPNRFKSAKIIQLDQHGSLATFPFLSNNRLGYGGLFGFHVVKNHQQKLVLTETEADAMAVYQATRRPAVCLPRGCSTLPQEALPFLEGFSDIVIWFSNDMQTFAHAKCFAKKLGPSRTLLVRPAPENLPPLKALQAGLDLNKILKSAKSIQHSHIVSFSQHREEVLNELQYSEQVAGVKWAGYPKLNEILKGHRRGELTVFTGGTGTGKTTFISDYSLDLCQNGVNTLWGSFEIPNVRLMKMMLQQFAKKNLAKHVNEFDYFADRFEQLYMYFMNFHGKENIHKVIETMSHAVYVFDITHVVVDNLQFMMGSDRNMSDRFYYQDVVIGAFRRFATNMNCHVTLVVHPRKEDAEELTTNSIFGGAKASQEADNIMILQKAGMGIHARKYLQVTKNRFDGHLGSMSLRFDKNSQSFSMKTGGEDSNSGSVTDSMVKYDDLAGAVSNNNDFTDDDTMDNDDFESQW